MRIDWGQTEKELLKIFVLEDLYAFLFKLYLKLFSESKTQECLKWYMSYLAVTSASFRSEKESWRRPLEPLRGGKWIKSCNKSSWQSLKGPFTHLKVDVYILSAEKLLQDKLDFSQWPPNTDSGKHGIINDVVSCNMAVLSESSTH